MSPETLNALLFGMAVAAAIGNILAFLVARFELHGQRQETRDLAKLTSELEHKVHRLTIEMDQRIKRFDRIRDLITGSIHVSITLRQGSRPHQEKLDVAYKHAMTIPELEALAKFIGDEQLSELCNRLAHILKDGIWPLMWNERKYNLGEADKLIQDQVSIVGDMHYRILELLEQATISEPSH